MPAKAVEEHIMGNEMSPKKKKGREDVGFLSDIIMWMLANRDMAVCLSTLATAIHSMASQATQQGREYIAVALDGLSQDIRDMEDPAVN